MLTLGRIMIMLPVLAVGIVALVVFTGATWDVD